MKKFFALFALLAVIASVPPIALGGYAFFEIFAGNYDHLKRERILEILSKESMLYYSDGVTQLGSLFSSEHRQYLTLKEIPVIVQQGVIAAEDDEFYSHLGVSFVSTARAAVRNLFLGKREGASTITQQTVKNLYGRPVTNLKAKFFEAINSFKMERVYSKEEILEFYLNQFHVTGNGRGVGVAAKYYFNKEVHELTLSEAAFIAGSVKGPERYNPFTKRAIESQEKAKSRAKVRKDYVLRRMLENDFITQADFEAAVVEEVPFLQGRFQFNELFITELVQRQINRKEVLSALGAETAEEVGSLGLRITTTLDQAVQRGAIYGVRQNLSRLEMILSGFEKAQQSQFMAIQKPELHGFYTGQIESISTDKGSESLTLSFGLPRCTVPPDGLVRVAKITDQALYRGIPKSLALLMKQLQVGDYVLASVREMKPDGELICDLERHPRIQGSALVLDKGQVVAMVGGFAPHEYNRAVFAKRQPGSTFKTLTYYPALQLGWHILEPLLNSRNVYTWQGQFYFPRPDHSPETLETTFAGAGAKSENLASIWLLAHMLDRLTFSQFKDLLVTLELALPGENENDVARRLSAKYNAPLNETHLRAGVFSTVRTDLLDDISVSHDKLLRYLVLSMNYGTDFEAEAVRVIATKPKKMPEKEKEVRLNVLKNSFLRWDTMRDSALTAMGRVKELVQSRGMLSAEDLKLLASFRRSGESMAWMSENPFQVSVVTPQLKDPELGFLSPEEVIRIAESNLSYFSEENLLLDGILPMSIIAEMKDLIETKFISLMDAGPMEKLFRHDDFRFSLGMIYAQRMTKQMGVKSRVEWVPSFPLGANDVTLAELALAYQTILNGQVYRFFDEDRENQLLLVKRIEDDRGNLLWEAERQEHQLIDDFYSAPMLSVLRGTVTNGTARAANRTIILRSQDPAADAQLVEAGLRIPSFGKTGTTNDYVNATYVGFLPYPEHAGVTQLSPANAYTIAAYVGYDTNEPMRRGGFKVAGGTGALPAWIEIAKTLILEQKYAEKIEWQPMVEKKFLEVPFDYGDDTQRVTVPVHGAASLGERSDEPEDSEADLDEVIDDYASSAKTVFQLAVNGRASNGIFFPTRRVSPFIARVKESDVSEDPEPVVEDVSSAPGAGSVPAAPLETETAPIQKPGDVAKNAAPAAENASDNEKLTPRFPIPKFNIDDTFSSEDPVN